MARPGPRPFAERLLVWWDRHGRKHLPWQQPRTPYRVWVSEIMLQQTQVATVIPYFERWMARFPDIESLAEAPLDDVLSHWSGLGYYARARNLHKTARRCRDDHGGELPLETTALSALPGIGESTANAIVSQATDRPAAVLDGNVRRVLARHAAIEGWTGKASVQKALWTEAVDRLPAARGADYTQAVMDLGALVCTRSSPACVDCPVSEDCAALQRGRV
ncbi:MAG: A/G-specific adenine glycosylase, partial [Xanthomonadales bacterium]|nr:A/G-specific adenine glycosylase [Xanthomonadales bacterium]